MNFKEKECQHCKKMFKPLGATHNYCSRECKFYGIGYTLDGDCHISNGTRMKGGYRIVSYLGVKTLIHRIACEIKHGPAPKDKPIVIHSCENKACCNPDHVSWGNHRPKNVIVFKTTMGNPRFKSTTMEEFNNIKQKLMNRSK